MAIASLLTWTSFSPSLRHAFDAGHGLPAQFPPPSRELGEPPQTAGPLRGLRLDMLAMAESYSAFLGLDARHSLPLRETAHDPGPEIRPHEESR